MKAGDLKGRAVVTLSDAAKVGQIDDVLFDADYRTVLGFRIKQGFRKRSDAVLRDSVSSIGSDAVTVTSHSAINNADRFDELVGAATLGQAKGTKVVTEGGEQLGTIDELELDEEARTVLAYTLSAPILERLRHNERRISANKVLRLGAEGIMIVSKAAADRRQSQ